MVIFKLIKILKLGIFSNNFSRGTKTGVVCTQVNPPYCEGKFSAIMYILTLAVSE